MRAVRVRAFRTTNRLQGKPRSRGVSVNLRAFSENLLAIDYELGA
jgi:hypothetical protein